MLVWFLSNIECILSCEPVNESSRHWCMEFIRKYSKHFIWILVLRLSLFSWNKKLENKMTYNWITSMGSNEWLTNEHQWRFNTFADDYATYLWCQFLPSLQHLHLQCLALADFRSVHFLNCNSFEMLTKNFSTIQLYFRPITTRHFSSTSSPTVQQLKLVNLTVDNTTSIATLKLNRPPVNTLNAALLQDISSALTEVEKNQSKGLILTSVCITVSFWWILKVLILNIFFSSTCFFISISPTLSRRRRYFRPAWIFWRCTSPIPKMAGSFGLQCKMFGWNCMVHRIQQWQQLM